MKPYSESGIDDEQLMFDLNKKAIILILMVGGLLILIFFAGFYAGIGWSNNNVVSDCTEKLSKCVFMVK